MGIAELHRPLGDDPGVVAMVRPDRPQPRLVGPEHGHPPESFWTVETLAQHITHQHPEHVWPDWGGGCAAGRGRSWWPSIGSCIIRRSGSVWRCCTSLGRTATRGACGRRVRIWLVSTTAGVGPRGECVAVAALAGRGGTDRSPRVRPGRVGAGASMPGVWAPVAPLAPGPIDTGWSRDAAGGAARRGPGPGLAGSRRVCAAGDQHGSGAGGRRHGVTATLHLITAGSTIRTK